MSKYGTAAVMAVGLIRDNTKYSPLEAWENSTLNIFGETPAQKKSCPKSTFLGLCETGLVKGVQSGDYTKSKKNKDYAIKAIEFIRNDDSKELDWRNLWDHVTGHINISHNSQMDVVIALYQEGFLDI